MSARRHDPYFFIQNGEDGIHVTRCNTEEAAKKHINGIAGPDLDPKWRANFQSGLINEYSPERDVLVIRGEVVIPQPVTTVTEWAL